MTDQFTPTSFPQQDTEANAFASSSEPVLEAVGLQKTYGRRRVVDGVNLHVGDAEIVGLLGPNGAGKSTSFRMICGLVQPDQGRVYLSGQDVTDWPMFRRARDGHMGYLPQEPSVFKKLTVEQNISALFELLGVGRKERKERTQALLEEFNITHIRKSRAAGLSGGERRRLEIARCLVSNPRIVMLDEPFAGIDPVTVQSIQGVIQQLRDSGISVLITDHAAREILTTVDRCYVIYQGQVLIDGTPDEVKRHPKVREEYLGDLDAAAGVPMDETANRPAASRPAPRPTNMTPVPSSAAPNIRPDAAHSQPSAPAAQPRRQVPRRRVTDV
ncbi:LPS export ABC transporter ATP-binding protein [Rhodopirellula sp. JC740]|uniref:LPS export ABC transporter ATP-binding protein n=1 Tax=Rhodopirellula halodulae TaxID=2894198 RepID=A0ABS8NLU5_9BACT|nr:LPS export ABC transporter ATP-binding protein [Rhodopirellula sp. JC740]MCC9644507.1 LPS export ABC transporter ATP-binding protein [Rhodopirellula sp. JC740]